MADNNENYFSTFFYSIDTGDLAFLIGIITLAFAVWGLVFIYRLMKKDDWKVDNPLEKLIDIGKWFFVSVAIVIGASIISNGFLERDQDIEEMQLFEKYATTFSKTENAEERLLLAEYFSVVAPKGKIKQSWENYLPKVADKLKTKQESALAKYRIENKEGKLTRIDLETLFILNQFTEAANQNLKVSTEDDTPNKNEEHLIIISGDSTIKAAEDELKEAKLVSTNATIYKKRNSYRTVIHNILSIEEAAELINKVKKYNSDAYIVRRSTWCRDFEKQDKYFVCK